jgi:hypothetical protein
MLYSHIPQTVDQAVDLLISDLSLRDRVYIGNLKRGDLDIVQNSLSSRIEQDFGLLGLNRELLQSCREASGRKNLDPRRGVKVIVDALWLRLRETHRLKLVETGEGD